MRCPHCSSSATDERSGRTAHGDRRFRCRGCGRRFNERTGTALNQLQLPMDVVFLIVLWRLRRKLSLRDPAEILLLRGLVFSHEAVREWEAKLAPLLTAPLLPATLRQRRRGKIGRPETVTSDKHAGYRPALEKVFGDGVEHRTSKYKNSHLEQDHRGVEVTSVKVVEFLGDVCFVMMAPSSQEMGPPRNPARFKVNRAGFVGGDFAWVTPPWRRPRLEHGSAPRLRREECCRWAR
ncbi:IS1/IS1595 family N-terminal zinc-binding domain-containing protein [Azospirillum sp. ST 5-10]|uniref:IS1/IS1595 family N-terminal zinc-binding domain-containing protein n=1 Tax=unclassified Azospirillum TaxID=2630922 RepID=UPI003F49C629